MYGNPSISGQTPDIPVRLLGDHYFMTYFDGQYVQKDWKPCLLPHSGPDIEYDIGRYFQGLQLSWTWWARTATFSGVAGVLYVPFSIHRMQDLRSPDVLL
ncbi:MAG: hypothetical protein WAZ77_08920 [Candidatus Nitrosopolaris sp.]